MSRVDEWSCKEGNVREGKGEEEKREGEGETYLPNVLVHHLGVQKPQNLSSESLALNKFCAGGPHHPSPLLLPFYSSFPGPILDLYLGLYPIGLLQILELADVFPYPWLVTYDPQGPGIRACLLRTAVHILLSCPPHHCISDHIFPVYLHHTLYHLFHADPLYTPYLCFFPGVEEGKWGVRPFVPSGQGSPRNP